MSDSPFVPHAVLIDRRWFIQRFGEPRIAFPAASMNLQLNADWFQLRSAVVEWVAFNEHHVIFLVVRPKVCYDFLSCSSPHGFM